MQFAYTPEELGKITGVKPAIGEFTGARMLWVRYRTDADFVRRALPPPLRPTGDPGWGTAFVARYPSTTLGVAYSEGAVFIDCAYKGESGAYCLSMPVDNDTAMVAGREFLGFPKKMADRISLENSGEEAVGSVIRRGVQIIRIEGRVEGSLGPEDVMTGTRVKDPAGVDCLAGVSFLFKFFPGLNGRPFDHLPQLIRQVTLFRPRPDQLHVDARLSLTSSDMDAVGDIPVLEVAQAGLGTFDNSMLPGKRVKRIFNLRAFAPYALFKQDVITQFANSHPERVRRRERREAERQFASF